MKQIFLFLFLASFLSCHSTKEDASSKIRNENPDKKIAERLSSQEIIERLEQLNYFSLTDSSDLEVVKTHFEKNYKDFNFFQGPLREGTLRFMDNRYYWVDCEELFEIDGLTEYLSHVKTTFEKLGLELEFGNEKDELNQNNWKHTIELNGIEYDAFEGEFSELDWEIAYVNFIEMLNAELRRQHSEEQFYPVNCGNSGGFVLLTPKQLVFINENYPIDDQHPTIMSSWKSINGL
ncbi:hypothetical protein ACJD0Z_04535 [Flavobacteriaceae bacterium M23B6Z8]